MAPRLRSLSNLELLKEGDVREILTFYCSGKQLTDRRIRRLEVFYEGLEQM